MSILLQTYTDKSFVLRGNTRPVKDEIMKLGGRWNTSLTGGAAWIFPSHSLDQVKAFVDRHNSNNSNNSNNNSDNNSDNNESGNVRKRSYTTTNSGVNSDVVLSRKEYLQLLSRIERIEQELKLKSLGEHVTKLVSNIQTNVAIENDNDEDADDQESDDDCNENNNTKRIQPLLRRNK